MLKTVKNKDEIKLTDLIDTDVLQRIQDSFANAVGMAALTTEADGTPVTAGSNFTDYCQKYTRCSELGRSMCEECDRYGAEVTMKTGKYTTYVCHSGLIDFSAPIIVEGRMIGCFIGGQALFEAPNEDIVRETARELEIDEDAYWEAIQKIPIINKERIDKAAEFLYTLAGALSDMAYGKYLSLKANAELNRAAKMQSDFLANMSHEIRTPMNAVIGFAEMALREDLPPNAADYITQIKNSGKALLTIINDILDYSKIEAGKMELIPVEYEPLSLIDDVANIIMTRLVDKDVNLLIDVNPNIPLKLIGDNVRIRQILINLCNNATKFTNEGYVKLVVDYEWSGYDKVILHFSVIDTGIGIKEEDLENIFNSFQQADSRRNRNIEGTGLGLAICRMLLKLMNSDLEVESVYGEGSVFSFSVEQPVADSEPTIMVDDVDNICLGAAVENNYVTDDFVNDAAKLNLEVHLFKNFETRDQDLLDWVKEAGEGKRLYFFLDQKYFDPNTYENMRLNTKVTPVILAETFADIRSLSKFKELKILRKPISVLNLGNLLNNKAENTSSGVLDQDALYSFTAEEVNVLIVDDNIVNLSVAQGLIEPLKAQIDGATSGKEALRMMKNKHYDIVFMDHMMPEMDGIDTTLVIRETMHEYDDVPIIALTANAVSGAREMFLDAGMNDFVPKPIEVRGLIEMFRRYVPQDKIHRISAETLSEHAESIKKPAEPDTSDDTLVIADLDTKTALKMLGSEKLYMNILKTYYDSIEDRSEAIRNFYKEMNWREYAIEVHALKSASRQIGATELGELAYKLEMAGKGEEIDVINKYTYDLLDMYLAYKDKLAYLFKETRSQLRDADKPEATYESLKSLFGRMRVAVDDLDMDEMEAVISDMGGFRYSDFWQDKFNRLKNAVNYMDVDSIIDILDDWK